MKKKSNLPFVIIAAIVLGAAGCSKSSSSPTQVQAPGPQLTAVPASAAVGVGTSQNVVVSGGTPPYSVSAAPSGIATAVLSNSDSLAATLTITGVTVASVSTAVTIRDAPAAKTVTIPISVH